MLVREVMSTEPVTTQPDTTVKEALRLLDECDVTTLPVVTRSGRTVGVVSEADLIRDQIAPDPRLSDLPRDPTPLPRAHYVDDVMSAHPVTVRPETDLATAIDLMTSTSVKSLPVVDEHDRVVGVLSRRDVVKVLARSDDLIESELDALIVSIGVRDWLVEVHDGVAEIDGPADRSERTVATVLASAVPGVVEVRVR